MEAKHYVSLRFKGDIENTLNALEARTGTDIKHGFEMIGDFKLGGWGRR